MPKTAAQILPLKAQLAGQLALYRFADATSDFVGANTVEELSYDNSGVNALGVIANPGVAITPLNAAPSGFAGTPSNTGGILRGAATVQYGFSIASSATINNFQFPNANNPTMGQIVWFAPYTYAGATGGAVRLDWSAQNFAGVALLTLWKVDALGRLSTANFLNVNAQINNTYTDVSGPTGFLTQREGANGYAQRVDTSVFADYNQNHIAAAYYGYGFPGYQSSSNLLFNSAVTFTVVPGAGSWSTTGAAYRLSAYNALGETLPTAEVGVAIAAAANTQTVPTTMGAVTATPVTGASGLPAGTYYYVVTAETAGGGGNPQYAFQNRYGFESLPSPEVSAVLASTGIVNLSWAAVPGATGYVIYRSTTSGDNRVLAQVGATTNYADNNSTPLQTLKVPTTYGAGYTGSGSAAFSWTALAGAVGYFLYKGVPGQAQSTLWNSLDRGALTSFTETGTGAGVIGGSRYYPQSTTAAPLQDVHTVGRVFYSAANKGIGRIGVTFIPVAGKSYRLFISGEGNQAYFQGPYVNFASGGVPVYFEQIFNGNLGNTNYNYWIGVQGSDATALVAWNAVTKANTQDNLAAFDSESGTMMGFNSYNPGGTPILSNARQQPGSQSAGYLGTYVMTEAGATLPMKITTRNVLTGQSATKPSNALVTTFGTLLGGYLNRGNRVVYTTNQILTTPVKAIVPNAASAAPSSPQVNNAILATRLGVTYEVSTDGGATWFLLTLGARFTFATAATQMQFRITLPQMLRSMTMIPPPAVSGGGNGYITNFQNTSSFWLNYINGGSPSGLDDTNLPWFYSDAYGGTANTGVYATYVWLGYNYNVFAAIFFNNIGFDVDVTAYVSASGGSSCGVMGRASDFNNGYYFYVDSAGNYGLQRVVGGGATTLATATGNQGNSVTTRMLIIGAHIVCFVNGKLVIDITDASPIAATAANSHAGVRGQRGYVYSMTATNPTIAGLGTNPAPQSEIEYLSAYLET